MKRPKISVALAVFNEEKNLAACLDSVRGLADEIIVVDGSSTDKTVEVAKKYKAKVIITDNPPIFHLNKQKAIDECTGDWILQLDADEQVTLTLSQEIRKIIRMSQQEIEAYQKKLPERELFARHQKILAERDGRIGQPGKNYAGFFVARRNYFLGKYLRYGGVYPDGVIRLVKKGKAYFPCRSVHEQIVVEGGAGWLKNSLIHMADPTFKRYLERNSRYIDLIVTELEQQKVAKNLIQLFNYLLIKPAHWVFLTLVRHKGILDGGPGVIFSLFSSLRFPRAYWRYLKRKK